MDLCGRSQADLIEEIERYKLIYRDREDKLIERDGQLIDLVYKYDAARSLAIDLWIMLKSDAASKPARPYAETTIDRMIKETIEMQKKSEETTNVKETGTTT